MRLSVNVHKLDRLFDESFQCFLKTQNLITLFEIICVASVGGAPRLVQIRQGADADTQSEVRPRILTP